MFSCMIPTVSSICAWISWIYEVSPEPMTLLTAPCCPVPVLCSCGPLSPTLPSALPPYTGGAGEKSPGQDDPMLSSHILLQIDMNQYHQTGHTFLFPPGCILPGPAALGPPFWPAGI